MDTQQQLQLAAESLQRLEAFLQTRGVAAGVLRSLRQTVDSAGSWERSRVQELQQDLASIVPDIARLEALAVSLDGSLCKAHLHLSDGAGGGGQAGARTTCRALADLLGAELEAVRSQLGAKQSEAEELGALWTAFRQRREQLLKSVEDLEQQAEQQGLREPSVTALQHRLEAHAQKINSSLLDPNGVTCYMYFELNGKEVLFCLSFDVFVNYI